jgi:excinuclease ABC subunit C
MLKLTFTPDEDERLFHETPATAAVFILRGDGEPYVSKTASLRRRLQRLLGPPAEQSKRLNLRHRVREIEYTAARSEFEIQFLLYQVLRETFPKTYTERLRLRLAPLVKLHLENQYPRASVTRRLGKIQSNHGKAGSAGEDVRVSTHAPNLYYGPFPSRSAAERFASDALDFFKMRRCIDDLHPDPTFPGCVYSEMKMCLAPCFKGCTNEEYSSEVDRVREFLDSRGESLIREFTLQRERASAELAFEDAAAVHAKIEKVKPLLSQLPEIVHRIDRLKALIVQPGIRTESRSEGEGDLLPAATVGDTESQTSEPQVTSPVSVSLFLFQDCMLRGPVAFSIEPQAESRSMESRLLETIENFPAAQHSSASEHAEHLAILKRWYFRSSRTGEIFFADERGSWPFRRIVRGIGRVARGEKPQEPAQLTATQSAAAPSDAR